MSHAERMWRRMQNVVNVGRTTAPADESGNASTVQHAIYDSAARDAVPVAFHFGFAACLPVGSDTVTVQVAGSSSNGIIVATGHQASRPKGLKPGESMMYNQRGDHVHFRADGTIEVRAATQVSIVSPTVHVTGDLRVDGDVTAGPVSLRAHTHPDPQGGNTGQPS